MCLLFLLICAVTPHGGLCSNESCELQKHDGKWHDCTCSMDHITPKLIHDVRLMRHVSLSINEWMGRCLRRSDRFLVDCLADPYLHRTAAVDSGRRRGCRTQAVKEKIATYFTAVWRRSQTVADSDGDTAYGPATPACRWWCHVGKI